MTLVQASTPTVFIGGREVGPGQPAYIVAELGINHNGSMDIARKLIASAQLAACDAVKFQKRTIDVVYTAEELAKPRENPFGETNGNLKRGLEFGLDQYREIEAYCKQHNTPWFFSCWDEASVDFAEQFSTVCYKIASASLTDDNLLRYHRKTGKPIVLSTGMSSLEQIDHAVDILGKKDLIILHCTSTYPSALAEINLRAIPELGRRYGVPIGYSGHEVGLSTTIAAATLGACFIERHLTLDRSMWGSDQAASIEPQGMSRLVRDIRAVEKAMGDGEKCVYPSEIPIRKKLRRV